MTLKSEILSLDLDQITGAKPLLPAVFYILGIYLGDREKAIKQSHTLSEALDNKSYNVSDLKLWQLSSELVNGIFDSNITGRTIISNSKEFHKFNYTALHVLCFCGIAIKEDVDLEMKITLQAQTIPWLTKTTSPFILIQNNIIFPFFENYWLSTFKNQRLNFRTPQLLARTLEEAKTKTSKARFESIMTAIGNDFGVTISSPPPPPISP